MSESLTIDQAKMILDFCMHDTSPCPFCGKAIAFVARGRTIGGRCGVIEIVMEGHDEEDCFVHGLACRAYSTEDVLSHCSEWNHRK